MVFKLLKGLNNYNKKLRYLVGNAPVTNKAVSSTNHANSPQSGGRLCTKCKLQMHMFFLFISFENFL